jgi:hypothetical protein
MHEGIRGGGSTFQRRYSYTSFLTGQYTDVRGESHHKALYFRRKFPVIFSAAGWADPSDDLENLEKINLFSLSGIELQFLPSSACSLTKPNKLSRLRMQQLLLFYIKMCWHIRKTSTDRHLPRVWELPSVRFQTTSHSYCAISLRTRHYGYMSNSVTHNKRKRKDLRKFDGLEGIHTKRVRILVKAYTIKEKWFVSSIPWQFSITKCTVVWNYG